MIDTKGVEELTEAQSGERGDTAREVGRRIMEVKGDRFQRDVLFVVLGKVAKALDQSTAFHVRFDLRYGARVFLKNGVGEGFDAVIETAVAFDARCVLVNGGQVREDVCVQGFTRREDRACAADAECVSRKKIGGKVIGDDTDPNVAGFGGVKAVRAKGCNDCHISAFCDFCHSVNGDLYLASTNENDLRKLVNALNSLIFPLVKGAFDGSATSKVLKLNEHISSPNSKFCQYIIAFLAEIVKADLL